MFRRFSFLLVVVIVVGLGLGAGAGAIQARMNKAGGSGGAAVTGQQTQSARAASGQNESSTTAQATGQRGGFGTVENVTAGGFVLVLQGTRTQVVTNGETKVTRMADVKATDLKVGESIVATGSQQADGSFAASSIQAGGAGGMQGLVTGMMGATGSQRDQSQSSGQGNRPAQDTAPGGVRGTGGAQGAMGSALIGTIEAIDGSTITVKSQAGSSSKVATTSSTTVRKMADGTLSDIKEGLTATVVGERNGDGATVATSVQLVPSGMTPSGR